MAQNICALIVLDHVNVPSEIVHFREHRAFVIPLDPKLYNDWWGAVSIFIAHVANATEVVTALDTAAVVYSTYEDEDNEGPFPYDFSALASRIKSISPDRFMLIYYEDFADVATHELFLTVVDGKVVNDATCYYDEEFEFRPEFHRNRAYHELISQGARIGWLHQDKYRSYEKAKQAFENQQS
ncbi:hypothetical protein [Pedobacter nanyangensis]|uniref:hypothetical protein n=1 Tax=Pedobacter nanyangensis TaxID=1562389 RepID=UPI000DE41B2C|nr:hypothetical protein [Pedobacter nanyangensis]